MAAKRLSEYDEIVASHGKGLLTRYRTSFAHYAQVSLTASCIAYSLYSIAHAPFATALKRYAVSTERARE
ncbi:MULTISPECIES: UbiA prenyltransferase family protein [Rhizobium]|uniref:hypothetical protein n=1 Tax=Rhizobium TaxID=379 RepID=UPI001FEF4C6A|nr:MULTISPECIES: hypothetical protein [Rhizobium]